MKKLLAIIAVVSAYAIGKGQYRDNHESTIWQYDDYRKEIASIKAQEAKAEEFRLTNTSPGMGGLIVRDYLFQWTPRKGDKELGYRIDGTVVWREVPEVK